MSTYSVHTHHSSMSHSRLRLTNGIVFTAIQKRQIKLIKSNNMFLHALIDSYNRRSISSHPSPPPCRIASPMPFSPCPATNPYSMDGSPDIVSQNASQIVPITQFPQQSRSESKQARPENRYKHSKQKTSKKTARGAAYNKQKPKDQNMTQLSQNLKLQSASCH